MKLFRRSIYDIRINHFPNLPTSIEIAIDELNEMQNKIQYKGEQFSFMSDDKNMIVFICKINLEAISNAEHVFGDWTFTYVPKLFMQLYTLHIYKNNFYIPLVYCFSRNKQTSSYLMLWDMLEKLCVQLTNKPLQINIFHVDFEKATYNAVLKKFPNSVIVCCNFHLGQSWYRRIQQNKLILKEY